jgi:hypothetical protein
LIKKIKKKFSAVILFQFLVIKALDPDPYWSPTSYSESGSGSGKNEYGSTTLIKTVNFEAKMAYIENHQSSYVHNKVLDS